MELLLFFVVLVLLLALGNSIAVVLIGASLFYLALVGLPQDAAVGRLDGSLNSFTIMAVPFFIIAAEIMNEAKLTQRLVDWTQLAVGHFRGGLAQVNIAASMIFAGMSGSALADAGGLGKILIPAMERDGYSRQFSAAITAASCTIGPLIPPSIAFVLYGVIAEVSIGRLFLGGAVPGVLLGLSLMIVVRLVKSTATVPRRDRASVRRVVSGSRPALLALGMPVIILLGISGGVFTPTEAAVVAALYALTVGLIILRTLNIRRAVAAALSGMLTTGSVLFIAAGTAVFGYILAREGVITFLLRGLSDWAPHPLVFLLVINLVLLVIGCFIEPVSGILLLAPIMAPVALSAGIDPIHFGVIFVMNLNFGLVTPPLGLALYIVSDISRESVGAISRAILPFYVPMALVLAAVSMLPALTLWLPGLLL